MRDEIRRELTRSSCLQANSSSWFRLTFAGSLSMTGREIVFTEDSTISAPYWRRDDNGFKNRGGKKVIVLRRTLTTLELALPCS
jgi:hypothetical protein